MFRCVYYSLLLSPLVLIFLLFFQQLLLSRCLSTIPLHFLIQTIFFFSFWILSVCALTWQLARNPDNLEELAQNEALMQALSRIIREEGMRSPELQTNLLTVFYFFSTCVPPCAS